MSVPAPIATAADNFRYNSDWLSKSLKDLTPEEWLRQPNETSNHLLWVTGHVIWARGNLLGLLGTQWSKPWLPLFARGTKVLDTADYPTPEAAFETWNEVAAILPDILEQASDEVVSAPAPPRIPSADGKVSGVVAFLAVHETYHVGQAAYLRCWLGHPGAMG
jgi:hypothetical protein